MATYRVAWAWSCGLVAALGLVAAFVLVPMSMATVSLFLPLAVVAGLLAAIGITSSDESPGARHHTARRVVTIALTAGTGGVCLAGLIGLLGAAAVPLLLIVGATSPPVISRFVYLRGPRHTRRQGDQAALWELPTATLCRQWQDSYPALRSAPTHSLRLQIVEARAQCLDELERRDPEGLNAWLGSNASAASDPGLFITRPQ